MKRDEYVCDCSDIDDIIAFTNDGKFMVSRISEKTYMGKDIRHIAIFEKNEENKIYNIIYQDGPRGAVMVKRFNITGITRDKVYDLTKGTEGSKILYFGISGPANAPLVNVFLKPRPKLKNLQLEVNFNEMIVKNRSAMGNVLTKFPVAKVRQVGVDAIVPESIPVEPAPVNSLPQPVTTSEKKGGKKVQTKLEF
jgi:topoisomerase IV subunit A